MLARTLPQTSILSAVPPVPVAGRASIVVDVRCPRCGATVWFDDNEWKCSMCARPVWRSTPMEERRRPIAATASPLREFIAECCETSGEGQVAAGELYSAYLDWAFDQSKEPLSRGAFAKALHAEGFQRFRTRFARYWRGLSCAV